MRPCQRAGILQEGGGHGGGACIGAQQRQRGKRRQAGGTALIELRGGKGLVVVRLQRRVDGVARVPGLHPHLAARGLRGIPPGAARGLHQQREESLRRTEVAAEQGAVGVDRGHQRDAAEIVPLGHHLRAHQHIHLAGMHGGQLLLQQADTACAVGIDAGDARLRQQRGQLFLQLLGATADGRDVQVAAVGAGAWHALAQPAVVAAQRAVGLVEDAPRAAMRTAALPAAGAAMQHRRVAAAVEQQQALFALFNALLDGRQQRRRKHALPAFHARQRGHVQDAHARHRAATDAQRQRHAPVAAFQRALPAFQRRRGRAQHHRQLELVRAPHRQVPRRIARAFLLLERRVVFFVDDDQPQPGQRRKHRQPRAQHQIGQAQVRQQPMAQALRRRQAAVQADHHLARKTLGKPRLELRREVDLRHQHQGLATALQGVGGGVQVDLGLAAASHAVQQHRAVGLGDGRDSRQLLIVQARRRGRHARGHGSGQRPHLGDTAGQSQVVDLAQLRRQHGHRQLADTALVVGGSKGDQGAPVGGQGRQRVQHFLDGAQLARRRAWLVWCVPHQAGHRAATQGHTQQHTRRERLLTRVVQQRPQRRVAGCFDGHRQGDRHAQPSQISAAARNAVFTSTKCAKCMISKDFPAYTDKLWITLCATCGQRCQVLDFVDSRLRCPFWRQTNEVNKINNLARRTVIFGARDLQARGSCAAACKLGISQDLSIHSQSLFCTLARPTRAPKADQESPPKF